MMRSFLAPTAAASPASSIARTAVRIRHTIASIATSASTPIGGVHRVVRSSSGRWGTSQRVAAVLGAAATIAVLPSIVVAASGDDTKSGAADAPNTTTSLSASSASTTAAARPPIDPKVALEQKENIIKHFNAHASLTDANGEKLMSAKDFLAALGTSDSEHVRALFGLADADRNQGISLAEYLAFASMLYSDEADLRVAFEIFDANHDGQITLEEFNKGLTSLPLSTSNIIVRDDSGFAHRFFGTPTEPRTLNLNEFRSLLNTLQQRLIRADFESNDLENSGKLSGQQFIKVLEDRGRGIIPKPVQENIYRYLSERNDPEISFEEYAAFHGLVNDLDRIESLIHTRALPNAPLKQMEFGEILSRATGQPLTTDNAGLLFHIFARPDHTIDPSSFLTIMKSRMKGSAAGQPTMSYIEYIGLSGVSAMIGATCVFPMDKIKTRLQTSTGNTTIIGLFKQVIKQEGVARLYRGLGPQLVGITPEKALKLTTNAFFVQQIGHGRELTFMEQVFAGLLTGMVQVTLTTPVEIVKIRLQMQGGATGVAVKSPLQVIQELGVRGLYTGYTATMLRDVPFNMIFFSTSALFKKKLANEKGEVTSLGVLAASAGAGSLAAALDTPADTIKTRLQAGNGKYSGIVDCVRKTVAEEGYRAFVKGLVPRILIISPLFGITMMSLSKLQELVKPYHRVPDPTVEQELTALRKARVDQIGQKLRAKYGF